MPKSDNTTPHLSSVYDDQVRNTIPYYDCFHRETIHTVKSFVKQPGFWLDTGCGTGSLVAQAVKDFPGTFFLLADPSPEMLRIAKQKLGQIDRVRFLEPAATQNLQPENSMEVITAIQAHHYLSKDLRKQATQVCYRLLKENGLYITFENIRPFSDTGINLGKERWADFQLSRGKENETVRKHLDRFDTEFFPITAAAHLSLLRESGFKTVELLWYSYMQAGFYAIK